ncbi:beta-1,3-galactosyltransferase 2-like [Hemicordylus capensis]|uniref:beta-1,3-galactosyltransferase 2-like n=1 Tax=Hemicordylus capensis TaxID=884348 RepID=UPI0023021FBD|nr:beta-1,3-galactosyltransferase 2-like [Hemicordylus capensis]XP_053104565.1 beta-1,3-galactosyltransferase 2-like [Hemicordylus capensis]XP_053104566.1 beta-1,3-galactosyltransferase 2-like [Hemicordylus capensis]XP_053104567.1 beta-1,3-galactosyltransferase 2-like [Hemicordylus capensis]
MGNVTLLRRYFSTSWHCIKLYISLAVTISFLITFLFLISIVSHYFFILAPTHDQENMGVLEGFAYSTKGGEKSEASIFFRNNRTHSFKENLQTIKEQEQMTDMPTFTSRGAHDKYIHLHPYRFLISESDKCTKRTPFLLLLISTTVNEHEHREAIRKTWGNEMVVPGIEVVRLFMLGLTKEGQNQAILQESRQYHDIIQQNFLDTYNNLTLKTLMGMTWVASYCSQANFVMKTDSDVFVNTEYLIQKLLQPIRPLSRGEYFTGNIMRGYQPHRIKTSKWYMPKEVYPDDNYPEFCSGTGYVFSTPVASKILEASVSIPYVHLEDIYVALCLLKEGISLTPPPRQALFNIHTIPFSPCTYNSLITSHGIHPSELLTFWQALQDKKHTCPE